MSLYVTMHRTRKLELNDYVSHDGAQVLEFTCDKNQRLEIWMPAQKARAVEQAFNQPVPDLLCDVDARLGELTQTGAHEYRYGDYIISRAEYGLWNWIDDKRGGGEAEHEGTCFSVIGCLDQCDEHREEMAEREADDRREAAMREAADDDRAHAQREREAGL